MTLTRFTVKVKNTSGVLHSHTPVTIRGVGGNGVKSIEDIGDVVETDVTDGSTLVYNASTDKYQIKKLDFDDLSANTVIDCGEF